MLSQKALNHHIHSFMERKMQEFPELREIGNHIPPPDAPTVEHPRSANSRHQSYRWWQNSPIHRPIS